jgi:lipid A 4'-phosphatase
VFCIASAAGLFAALLFSAFPEIDLAVSSWFYLGDRQFAFGWPSAGAVIRTLLRITFALVWVAAVIGFIALAFMNRRLMPLGLAALAYIALCAAVGPGLVANLGFKEHWGRARPAQVIEFGGTKQFTPPLLRTDQCDSNCAFISGEASNFYALGFAFAFLFGQWRPQLFLAAIAAGSFAGLIRIGAGGHFLSDIVFAGVFMAFVTKGLAWLILDRWAPYLADGGPVHQRTQRLGVRLAMSVRNVWHAIARRRDRMPPGSGNKHTEEH